MPFDPANQDEWYVWSVARPVKGFLDQATNDNSAIWSQLVQAICKCSDADDDKQTGRDTGHEFRMRKNSA